MYYETDALMYGAIFSSPDVYECQIQRLMKRVGELSMVYSDKENIISLKGCPVDTGLSADLLSISGAVTSVKTSADLINIASASDNADGENNATSCRLW